MKDARSNVEFAVVHTCDDGDGHFPRGFGHHVWLRKGWNVMAPLDEFWRPVVVAVAVNSIDVHVWGWKQLDIACTDTEDIALLQLNAGSPSNGPQVLRSPSRR
jgi:hypothetical protein